VGGGENERVGEVFSVFDQTAPRVAADHGTIGWGNNCFLKITQRNTRLAPCVDSQGWGLDVAKKRFVDGHIASGGGGGVK